MTVRGSRERVGYVTSSPEVAPYLSVRMSFVLTVGDSCVDNGQRALWTERCWCRECCDRIKLLINYAR